MEQRKIVFQNAREFIGTAFGSDQTTVCEVTFNTSMVGYQEIVTDATNAELGIVMTYPIIGNYGITDEDNESKTPLIKALIVRDYNDFPSNFRYTKTLAEIMEENKITGISEVDTREIVRMLRDEGGMKAAIVPADTPTEQALELINNYNRPTDLVKRISCKKCWYSRTFNPSYNIVVIDCGVKMSIIKALNERGCNVTVVPYNTKAETIMSLAPDGVLISNGPGAPEDAAEVVELIRTLRGSIPMLGIGLGHQLIALAYGYKVQKLKCDNRGENYPIRHIATGKIYASSKNQSHTVCDEEGSGLTVTYTSVPDNKIDGFESIADKVFTAQFHPEGAPGPNDTAVLFDKFIALMKGEIVNA